MMVHLHRRAVELAVRRFRSCHLDAQAASTEHEVEGEPSQYLWQPWREVERALLQAQATESRDQRRPGPFLVQWQVLGMCASLGL